MLTGIRSAAGISFKQLSTTYPACAHFLWITLCVTVRKQSKPLISKKKFPLHRNEAVYIRLLACLALSRAQLSATP
ncbi:hypothetical protein D3C87_577700 [compost metagenome]